VRIGQDHIESNREGCADEKNLEHEVVQGLLEDLPEGLSNELWSGVAAEMLSTEWNVTAVDTLLRVDLEKAEELLTTIVFFLNCHNVFIICARLVFLNEIDKLLLRDLECLCLPGCVIHTREFSIRLL